MKTPQDNAAGGKAFRPNLAPIYFVPEAEDANTWLVQFVRMEDSILLRPHPSRVWAYISELVPLNDGNGYVRKVIAVTPTDMGYAQ